MSEAVPTVSSEKLRETFDSAPEMTIGVEEEVMLLDPGTLDLAPVAPEVLARLGGDPSFKLEMPASQLEIVTPPHSDVPAAIRDLAGGRRRVAEAAEGLALPAAAGVHPFAAPVGELNADERYRAIVADYGEAARRQLVCALQVHVAVRGADRSLAVYNALRCLLPEIAALAAAAPFHAGKDTGLASVRPTISQLLPRQGVPPAVPTWEALAAELGWGAAAGTVSEPGRWWWELRPNITFGTLEVRVPDAQTTIADAAGVAAFVHALVSTLAERHDAGDPLPAAASWRIAENRWSAYRHGVEGKLADLTSGKPVPTRERLRELLDQAAPAGSRLGCESELADARRLVEENGAIRQRRAAEPDGPTGVARWLVERFSETDDRYQPAPSTGDAAERGVEPRAAG